MNMTRNRSIKQAIRARMLSTGETYMQAREVLTKESEQHKLLTGNGSTGKTIVLDSEDTPRVSSSFVLSVETTQPARTFIWDAQYTSHLLLEGVEPANQTYITGAPSWRVEQRAAQSTPEWINTLYRVHGELEQRYAQMALEHKDQGLTRTSFEPIIVLIDSEDVLMDEFRDRTEAPVDLTVKQIITNMTRMGRAARLHVLMTAKRVDYTTMSDTDTANFTRVNLNQDL